MKAPRPCGAEQHPTALPLSPSACHAMCQVLGHVIDAPVAPHFRTVTSDYQRLMKTNPRKYPGERLRWWWGQHLLPAPDERLHSWWIKLVTPTRAAPSWRLAQGGALRSDALSCVPPDDPLTSSRCGPQQEGGAADQKHQEVHCQVERPAPAHVRRRAAPAAVRGGTAYTAAG